jgi:preprotein translocase subunit SecG
MSFWTQVVIVAHVLVALGIIGLVLLQHGKGADMGSGFGGGSASSLFGATGSANFLSRATAVLATVFFALSLLLAYLATNAPRESGSVVDRMPQQKQPAKAEKKDVPPAAPVPSPDAAGQKPVPTPEGAKDRAVPQ